MDRYKVIIHSQSYNLCKELKKYEPKLNKEKHCIEISNADKDNIKLLKKYCHNKALRYEIYNNSFERGSSYRRTFFNTYDSINDHYFCAYCGKFIPKEQITVDHIVPVAFAKTNIRRQHLLKRVGINNINDAKNLTPSCCSCNSRKGTKTVGWISRGMWGRNKWFWYLSHSISFICINTIFYCVFSMLLKS